VGQKPNGKYQVNALPILFVSALALLISLERTEAQTPWPVEKTDAWQAQHHWLVGCNFTPSTAINQLEMWQAASFDPATIDRELGWAEQIGFTGVRVFLHNLLWQQDAKGFLRRIDQFLAIAAKHHIGVTFVLFDSCWNPSPQFGKQPEPKRFTHNSGWVQSPGQEYLQHPERFAELKPYIQSVIGHFKNDRRIDMWDVFNEPDNMNDPAYIKLEAKDKPSFALILLQETFVWAREAKPSQPLTSGVWQGDRDDP
jgi:GH35 family endo-1,4-beta-xylanase